MLAEQPTDLSSAALGQPSPFHGAKLKMGRYHLLRKLGEGGMGAVYEAYDPELGRKVAIKVLHTSDHRGENSRLEEQNRARLLREAKNLAKLSHPNVVSIFDVGLLDDRSVFVAMEYIRGRTLREVIETEPLTWQRALEYVLQAANGLAAAHEVGLLHRDFKPENLIVDENDTPKVLDFGLSKTALGAPTTADEDAEVPALSTRPGHSVTSREYKVAEQEITGTGVFAGTPGYMAPEQMRGQELDARADLFALCCVAFELLTGKRPFPSRPFEKRLLAISAGKLKWPRHVPRWLRRMVACGLAEDRDQRGTSIQAWTDSIREQLARRRRRGSWAFATTTISIPVVTAALWLQRPPTSVDPECRDAAPLVDDLLNGATYQKLSDAFARTELGVAFELANRATQSLEKWRKTWIDASRLLCPAQRKALGLEQWNAGLREEGRACLAEGRAEVQALLNVWKYPDLQQVLESGQTLASLSKPKDCLNQNELATRTPLPVDPGGRAFVLAQREKLKAAWMHVRLVDYEGAKKTISGLETRYRGELNLEIHAKLVDILAVCEFDSSTGAGFDTANPLTKAAIWSVASNQAKLNAQNLYNLWFARIYRGGLVHESEELLHAQEASVRRAGGGPGLLAMLYSNWAIWSSLQGNVTESREYLLRSLEQTRKDPEGGAMRTAIVLDALGYDEFLEGRYRRSESYYRQVEEVQTRIVPAGHPLRNGTYFRLGEVLVFDNRVIASLTELSKGWQECMNADMPALMCADVESMYASAVLHRGDATTSLVVASHLADLEAASGRRIDPMSGYVESKASEALLARGEYQSALQLAEIGLRKIRDEGSVHPNALSIALMQLIEAAISNSRLELASALFAELDQQMSIDNERIEHVRSDMLRLRAKLYRTRNQVTAAIANGEMLLDRDIHLNFPPSWRARHHLDLAMSLLQYGELPLAKDHADFAFELHQESDGLLPHLAFPYHEVLARIALAEKRYGDALWEIEQARLAIDPVQVLSNRLAPLFMIEAQVWWELDRSSEGRNFARHLALRALHEYQDWDAGAQDKVVEVQAWLRTHGPRA
jgi:serine/threonine protein kinase/tetratricopeptide (TPR) repeat protein